MTANYIHFCIENKQDTRMHKNSKIFKQKETNMFL